MTPAVLHGNDIALARDRISPEELARLAALHWGDRLVFVADVERGVVAAGGGLPADAVLLLLEDGGRQADLWGGTYFPGQGPERCLQYTSLINVRPSHGNRGMHVQDPELRERMRELIAAVLGEGEPLP